MNNKEKNKLDFNINFGGFYESTHDFMIESSAYSMLDIDFDDNDNDDNDSYYAARDKLENTIDWQAMQKQYCIDWLDLFNNEFDLDIEYKGLDSPSAYNYETDKIIGAIDWLTFTELESKMLANSDFIDYVNENSKSYDGFNSFYEGIDAVGENSAIMMMYITDYLLKKYSENNYGEQICVDYTELLLCSDSIIEL